MGPLLPPLLSRGEGRGHPVGAQEQGWRGELAGGSGSLCWRHIQHKGAVMLTAFLPGQNEKCTKGCSSVICQMRPTETHACKSNETLSVWAQAKRHPSWIHHIQTRHPQAGPATETLSPFTSDFRPFEAHVSPALMCLCGHFSISFQNSRSVSKTAACAATLGGAQGLSGLAAPALSWALRLQPPTHQPAPLCREVAFQSKSHVWHAGRRKGEDEGEELEAVSTVPSGSPPWGAGWIRRKGPGVTGRVCFTRRKSRCVWTWRGMNREGGKPCCRRRRRQLLEPHLSEQVRSGVWPTSRPGRVHTTGESAEWE
nr:uncharacterized protein LOC105880352 [Microcebus murinus]